METIEAFSLYSSICIIVAHSDLETLKWLILSLFHQGELNAQALISDNSGSEWLGC